MSSTQPVLHCLQLQQDVITHLQLHRPDSLNAINRQMLLELQQVIALLAQDPKIRVLIVQGSSNKAFAAGADISEMVGAAPKQAQELVELGQSVMASLEQLPFPVLAAVEGFALGGGCELIMACDMIIAGEGARFGLPEVKLGLIPGFGGCVRLPRWIGQAAATEWILTGAFKTALEAQEAGLVSKLVPDGQANAAALQLAQLLLSRAPLAQRAAKQILQTAPSLPSQQSAFELERRQFSTLFTSHDTQEGLAAFVAKREPQFRGQ